MLRMVLIVLLFLVHSLSFAKAVTLTPDKVNEWIALKNPNADKRLGHAVMSSALTHNVHPGVILAFMSVESRFVSTALSSEGAVSYMQVVPKYHASRIKGRNIWDPFVNVDVGTMVLSICAKTKGNKLSAITRCYSGGYGPWYANRIRTEMYSFLSFING